MADTDARRVSECLQQANACQATAWHWTVYTADSRNLVLSGTRQGLHFFAYLVFRSPLYVRLPQVLDAPAFERVPFPCGADAFRPPGGSDMSSAHLISIRTSDGSFWIVCLDVAFYRPENER